ncbi:MAG: efflux transporter outer membrane subunit [Burkholderiales bacterium]
MKRVAAIAALLLAGCASGPDYVRPDAPAQAAWRHAGQDWKPAEPRDAVPRGVWWTRFGDAQLDRLAAQAARANFSVVAADARYRQAQAATRQARAALFPGADAGLAVSRSRAPGATGTARSMQLDFDVSWEPDLWGRIARGVEAGEAGAAAAAADLESVRLSVVAALVQNYFSLRIADAQARLLRETIAGYAQTLKVTQNRYAAGVAAKSDVVQAETQLKGAQAQLADLALSREQLQNAIAVLAGETPAALSVEPAQALAGVPHIPTGLPSELLERRPDIAAAERRVAAANARIGVAQAAFYPSLLLSGGGGTRSPGIADLLSAPTRFWSLGAAAVQFLFDGGAREAVAEQARAAYDAEVALYRDTVLGAFQEVEDNLAALRILAEEIAFQQDAVRAARQSLEMTNNRYKAGTASFLEVITVQNIALANERSLLALQGRRLNAAVLLVKALGGGWEPAR